jgi:hypothetical protein
MSTGQECRRRDGRDRARAEPVARCRWRRAASRVRRRAISHTSRGGYPPDIVTAVPIDAPKFERCEDMFEPQTENGCIDIPSRLISNPRFGTAPACQYSVAKARFRLRFTGQATMQWTKLRKRFEELVAPSLQGRVQVHVTRYRETRGMDVGRGWITVDGKEVVSVQIPSCYTEHMKFSLDTLDFGRAVGTYVEIPISAARSSPDPLLRGLAFLDKRLGKGSLASVDEDQLHEFEKALWAARCRAEGIDS